MDTAQTSRTVAVELPVPSGRYRGDFPGGVSIGASSSSLTDDVSVWVTGGAELSAAEARTRAAALLAAADAVDAENRVLQGEQARSELMAWNSTGPSEELAEARALRLVPGDQVADVGGLFAAHAPGIIARVDADDDEVAVTAGWLPGPVRYPLAEAGAQLYLAAAPAARAAESRYAGAAAKVGP